MISSFNGVRLLSSHLIRDACRSIYEGVFDRKLDSGIWTLSRVIGGGGGSYPNNRLLSNTSIRGSVSLSSPDYEISNYLGTKPPPVEGVSEEKFQRGFKDWCNRYDIVFSSEGEKDYMFKWFCDNHPYGREFFYGVIDFNISQDDLMDYFRKFGNDQSQEAQEAQEELLEKSRRSQALDCPPDQEEDEYEYEDEDVDEEKEDEEVFYSNEIPWEEFGDELLLRKCYGGKVFYKSKLSWDERNEYQEKCCPGRYIGSDRLPDIERGT